MGKSGLSFDLYDTENISKSKVSISIDQDLNDAKRDIKHAHSLYSDKNRTIRDLREAVRLSRIAISFFENNIDILEGGKDAHLPKLTETYQLAINCCGAILASSHRQQDDVEEYENVKNNLTKGLNKLSPAGSSILSNAKAKPAKPHKQGGKEI